MDDALGHTCRLDVVGDLSDGESTRQDGEVFLKNVSLNYGLNFHRAYTWDQRSENKRECKDGYSPGTADPRVNKVIDTVVASLFCPG